jgi:hypothetical protein
MGSSAIPASAAFGHFLDDSKQHVLVAPKMSVRLVIFEIGIERREV